MQTGSRRWLWFFLVLIVLGAAAASSLILYNLGQQLKPEALEAARRLWREKGPPDYRLVYTLKKGQARPDSYAVHVRHGQVESATINGKPAPPEEWPRLDVNGLFDLLDEHLKQRDQPGQPRTFMRAVFDRSDGHLRSYVHSPRGGPRLEITVEGVAPEEPRTK